MYSSLIEYFWIFYNLQKIKSYKKLIFKNICAIKFDEMNPNIFLKTETDKKYQVYEDFLT